MELEPWKDPPFLIGKPSIGHRKTMDMLNNQRLFYLESVIMYSIRVK